MQRKHLDFFSNQEETNITRLLVNAFNVIIKSYDLNSIYQTQYNYPPLDEINNKSFEIGKAIISSSSLQSMVSDLHDGFVKKLISADEIISILFTESQNVVVEATYAYGKNLKKISVQNLFGFFTTYLTNFPMRPAETWQAILRDLIKPIVNITMELMKSELSSESHKLICLNLSCYSDKYDKNFFLRCIEYSDEASLKDTSHLKNTLACGRLATKRFQLENNLLDDSELTRLKNLLLQNETLKSAHVIDVEGNYLLRVIDSIFRDKRNQSILDELLELLKVLSKYNPELVETIFTSKTRHLKGGEASKYCFTVMEYLTNKGCFNGKEMAELIAAKILAMNIPLPDDELKKMIKIRDGIYHQHKKLSPEEKSKITELMANSSSPLFKLMQLKVESSFAFFGPKNYENL